MHGCISPPLVEKPTSTIEVVEKFLVGRTTPEIHVRYLEIRPKVARRISVCNSIVSRPAFAVLEPVDGAVLMDVFVVGGEEFLGFRPERRYTLRRVVNIDGETISLVVVGHVPEYIIVDRTEEMNLRFHAPVVPIFLQRRVLVEESAVPSAHLMIRQHVGVLNVLFGEEICGFGDEIVIYPARDLPMLLWNEFCGLCQHWVPINDIRVFFYHSYIRLWSLPLSAS